MNCPSIAQWFHPAQAKDHAIPPRIRDWLSDEGSLTQRLKDRCPNQFAVKLLGMEWAQPDRSEAELLGVPLHEAVLLRQVHLHCGSQLCVYARSVIPRGTLQGPHRCLEHLGDKPLGEYLFASPTLQRKRIEWAVLKPGDSLYQQALADVESDSGEIWGRRSLFTIDALPLLVSEFFLPVLFDKDEVRT